MTGDSSREKPEGRDTVYKQIEKDLLFKNNIIRSSSCAIATCDLEGNMTYGNPFFQTLWRFESPEDFLGKHFRNFWCIENKYDAIMKAILTQGAWSGELIAQRKDGTRFNVQTSAANIFDQTGRPVALTSTSIDISERKAAQTQALQNQKIESLGRMAGAIAHHYNNLLTVVMGNLELVMGDMPGDSSQFKKLTTAMNAVNKATDISRLMLGYLGQTSGGYERISLSETCRRVLPLLQAAMPAGLTLQADFPASGPFIHANTVQIQQILTNLTTNAWESVSGHWGVIGLTIRTVPHTEIPSLNVIPFDWKPQPIPHACLEISDSGGGVPDQDIEKLFDPFFTTKFTGRGMGLPVVMGIVKAHGGCITVYSEPGKGSIFKVFLPT